MHWYVGLTVLHSGLSGTDHLRALAVLGRGYDNNVVSSFGHRLEMMKDRGGVTRVEYNFEDLPTPAWTFLHCWRSAVGEIPNEWEFASGFAPSYVLRYMLGFKPGYYRQFGHAHSWRPKGGWHSEQRRELRQAKRRAQHSADPHAGRDDDGPDASDAGDSGHSGGQRKLPTFARVLAFQSERLFAYAATDAPPTYHPDKCAQMVRQFLFLTPDYFVVFDRVIAKRADYPKTWLLHTGNEPAITGKEFQADQEQGRIFCRTLYPADAVLEKTGGPGKEFWADGRNWPIPAHSPYFRNLGIQDASDVAENMGRWRVEVKPGMPRTEDVFLYLIQVSDQTVTKMADSRVRETGEQIELTLTARERTYTVALNKTGDVGGRLRITEDEKAWFDQDLTRGVQPQTGLALTKSRESRRELPLPRRSTR